MQSTLAETQCKGKEEKTMKTSFAKKGLYVGTGAGLIIFVLFGLLPGSLLGGVAGINIAGWLFGLPLEAGLVSRVIVFMFMLIGTLISGVVIVTGVSVIGWAAGWVIDSRTHEKVAKTDDTFVAAHKR
jgi:hypothetical protein